jgi:hypothetical protein
MILQRAALLAAGPLAALGLSTGLAHADPTPVDLFSGDDISITAPDGLTGTPVEVGGLPPIDSEYEYAGQTVDVNRSADLDPANVYTTTDVFGGADKLVDLTPGEPIANSDIFDTYSLAGGAVVLEHAYIADSLAGLDTGSYDAVVLDGTTFALPEALSNALGPDFGLTALDVAILSGQASDAAASLDLTPFIDVLTSLF